MTQGSTAGAQSQSRLPKVLLAVAVLVFAWALATSVGSAAQDPGVKVNGKFISGSKITAAQDVVDKQYTVRSNPKSDGNTHTRSGTSIQALAALAGLDEGDVGYLTFTRPDGSSVYLSQDEIYDPAGSFEDGLQAIVFVDGSTVRFLRPLRKTKNDDDVNATDSFSTESGQSLTSKSGTGNRLGVDVVAPVETVHKGDVVTFSTKTRGLKSGEQATYNWTFSDDGGKAQGATVTHKVTKKGSVTATATATGDQGSGGQGSATVTVGKATTGGHPGTGQGGNDGGTGGSGDSGSNSASGTGDSGNAASGDASGTGTTDDGTGTTDYPPSYNYGDIPNFGTPDYNYGTPSYNTPGGIPGNSSNSAQAPPGTKDPTQQAPTLTPGLETVSGTLVTNVSDAGGAAPSGSDSSSSSASDPSSPSVVDFDDPSDPKSLTLPLTALGVVLLFVAGAGREQLRSRRRAL